MGTTKSVICPPEQHLPLSAKYACLQLVSTVASIHKGAAVRQVSINWAVGANSAGETESCGVLISTGNSAAGLWERGLEEVEVVLADCPEEVLAKALAVYPLARVAIARSRVVHLAKSLSASAAHRAVEIGFHRLRSAAARTRADVLLDRLANSLWVSLPAVAQVAKAAVEHWQPLYTLPHRRRDAVLRCEARVEALQTGLDRVLCRRRPFASEGEGAAFIEAWLERAVRVVGSRSGAVGPFPRFVVGQRLSFGGHPVA